MEDDAVAIEGIIDALDGGADVLRGEIERDLIANAHVHGLGDFGGDEHLVFGKFADEVVGRFDPIERSGLAKDEKVGSVIDVVVDELQREARIGLERGEG